MARRKGATAEITRGKILDCAESLFAKRGIAQVSMREIARESGEKNVAVAHYYFGTKEDLIIAIFEDRMEGFDAKRIKYLTEVANCDDNGDLRSILVAFIRPLAEQLDPKLARLAYLQFQLQVRVYSESLYNKTVLEKPETGVAEGIRMARDALPEIPIHTFARRIALATELVVYSIADRARRIEEYDEGPESSILFVRDLIDALNGLLSAHVSSEIDLPTDKLGFL